MKNRIVINARSPKNEQELIDLYKSANPKANRRDGMDISAVRTKDGEVGHALLPASINRSKDRKPHIGKDFISNKDLKKTAKK